MEAICELNLSQSGLLLDIAGFIVIFIFGGFQFGISQYVGDEHKWYVLPLRIIGFLLVIVGFVLQIIGAGQTSLNG